MCRHSLSTPIWSPSEAVSALVTQLVHLLEVGSQAKALPPPTKAKLSAGAPNTLAGQNPLVAVGVNTYICIDLLTEIFCSYKSLQKGVPKPQIFYIRWGGCTP